MRDENIRFTLTLEQKMNIEFSGEAFNEECFFRLLPTNGAHPNNSQRANLQEYVLAHVFNELDHKTLSNAWSQQKVYGMYFHYYEPQGF